MDYCDRRFCKELIVRGEPPEILKPREGTLYNPSLVCRAKLVRVVVGSEYYFELPPKSFAYLFAQFTAVAAVGDDLFYWCPLNFKRHDKTLRNASKHGVADSFFKTKPP